MSHGILFEAETCLSPAAGGLPRNRWLFQVIGGVDWWFAGVDPQFLKPNLVLVP